MYRPSGLLRRLCGVGRLLGRRLVRGEQGEDVGEDVERGEEAEADDDGHDEVVAAEGVTHAHAGVHPERVARAETTLHAGIQFGFSLLHKNAL